MPNHVCYSSNAFFLAGPVKIGLSIAFQSALE